MTLTQKLTASLALVTALFTHAQAPPAHAADPWWKHAVIYEIYPRSFQDTNGDGTGDLNGITQHLDYLESLGIDAIWISPLYPSPQVDFGYDISDYENVDPQYGTLADFDRLVAAARKHHIRILMDMVLNHTSDQHKWFQESKSSKDNPRRDWYIWRDGKPGGTPPNNPPNNWNSLFGHSTWEWDPTTSQYYYHFFYKQQPDLNWRNPAVEKAMFDSMKFWLDRGVAGFRLDAITALFEDPELHDAALRPGTNDFGDRNQDSVLYHNRDEEHDVVRRMRLMSDAYPGDRVLVGEVYLDDPVALDKWYGNAAHNELQLPMDMAVGFPPKKGRINPVTLRKALVDAETHIDGNQPLFVFDNHDQPRSYDRLGDGQHNDAIARLVAATLLTTRATALMYYGQELGMTTETPTRKEDVKDPIGITGWPKEKGRDGERTPMQWTAAPLGGFTTSATPWLPVPANVSTRNVATESQDPNSLLNWYKKLIALRRSNAALRNGLTTFLETPTPDLIAYIRHTPTAQTLVLTNWSATPQTLTLDATIAAHKLTTLLTNAPTLQILPNPKAIELPPFATWIGTIK